MSHSNVEAAAIADTQALKEVLDETEPPAEDMLKRSVTEIMEDQHSQLGATIGNTDSYRMQYEQDWAALARSDTFWENTVPRMNAMAFVTRKPRRSDLDGD